MSREVFHDGERSLRIRFSFDRRLVDLVKSLTRRRWLAEDKLWTVPDDDVVALVELLQPEGFAFDEEVRRRYTEAGGVRTLRAGSAPSPRGLFDAPPAEAPAPSEDWTVGRLNHAAKTALEAAFPGAFWLVGEIAGWNRSQHKRHVGFSLLERDGEGEQDAQVGAILFEGARREIEKKLAAAGDPFRLEDEVTVRVRVRVDLYEPWGAYRVQIEDLDVAYTMGEAARRREEIVRKLTADGLLGRNAALPMTPLPLSIGLVTSLGSDAYHDVLRTLRESGFAFKVTVHGARVQGRQTEPSVLNALDWFRARQAHFDAILVCRGGGSRTDLAWFDTERLGRAVALFPVPIVVGIGHEQDVSVLDHVARRAKTPTAAALQIVDAVRAAQGAVEETGQAILAEARSSLHAEKLHRRDAAARLARAVRAFLDVERVEVRRRRDALRRAPTRRIETARAGLLAGARQLGQGARRDLEGERRRVDDGAARLGPRASRALTLEGERTDARARRVHLVDPRRVVERGYAIVRSTAGRVITDPAAAPKGTRLTAELRAGRIAVVSEGSEP
ncbi:MAG TPA: exodeoxyribonuclease VII large subunit [Candidatus Polarisedimenticolaceae bacterium]|nr:exodeoxyribonuclease VII large subunit [Candidatus Polarisedimenticolaceae bacterium]